MEQPLRSKPKILLLPFEKSIASLLDQILTMEGYLVQIAYTAQEAFNLLEHDLGLFIVIMDNFHVNKEAQITAETIFASPALHARVKIVGTAAYRAKELIQLDTFIVMPFDIGQVLNVIQAMCAELSADK